MDVGKDALAIFNLVWRYDLSAPGFCLLDLGRDVDSRTVRSSMVTLKNELSKILSRSGKRFVYRSLGRFDQQVTTKFHLNGVLAESVLMLGYEPSKVHSRVFLADYLRCAFDLGMRPDQFLNNLSPMFQFHRVEEALTGYATELPQPEEGNSRILLINNSLLLFTDLRGNQLLRRNPLGVMHKAEIIDPNKDERRIVNSVMLTTAHVSESDKIGEERESGFLTSEEITPSLYGATAEGIE